MSDKEVPVTNTGDHLKAPGRVLGEHDRSALAANVSLYFQGFSRLCPASRGCKRVTS
jgi:hypothetical protein